MNVKELVSILQEAAGAYYNTGKVLMENEKYDALVATLRHLDPENAFLKNVGAPVSEGATKVGRLSPMGTLSKYHKEEEVKKWLEGIAPSSEQILLCPKYDGFGVELLYDVHGTLVMASTRGDGFIGEDITEAALLMDGVPHELPEWLIGTANLRRVRGEAIIPIEFHEKMKELGYSAMRNAVPGIVKSCRKDALTYVNFVAYEFFDDMKTRKEQRELYKPWFYVEASHSCPSSGFDIIRSLRNDFGRLKEEGRESVIGYEIDGVVLKSDVIKDEEADLLCPKRSIAWKFKSNREQTILRGIDYQLGATGKFTPIGIFDEVEFQGAKLTRASLGNMTRLYNFDVKPGIGSVIEVSRRGDIIPYIEEILYNDESVVPFEPLQVCPHCGKPLYTASDSMEPVCTNEECPEILRLKILQYVKGLGVKGIGSSLVTSLINAGKIYNLVDIYKVTREDILGLPGQGKTSADKWLDLQTKELTDLQFIGSYPFENLGTKFWGTILDYFTIEAILSDEGVRKNLSEFSVKGIGKEKINSLMSQLDEKNLEELSALYSLVNIR